MISAYVCARAVGVSLFPQQLHGGKLIAEEMTCVVRFSRREEKVTQQLYMSSTRATKIQHSRIRAYTRNKDTHCCATERLSVAQQRGALVRNREAHCSATDRLTVA